MSPVTPLINSKYGAEFISLSGAIGDFDLVYERWERALERKRDTLQYSKKTIIAQI